MKGYNVLDVRRVAHEATEREGRQIDDLVEPSCSSADIAPLDGDVDHLPRRPIPNVSLATSRLA